MIPVLSHSGRQAGNRQCWCHSDMSNNYCSPKNCQKRGKSGLCESFWFLVCTANVNNCKPAQQQLWSH